MGKLSDVCGDIETMNRVRMLQERALGDIGGVAAWAVHWSAFGDKETAERNGVDLRPVDECSCCGCSLSRHTATDLASCSGENGAEYPAHYTHFVYMSNGEIHSGWENLSDARDAARDPAEYGYAPIPGIRYTALSRSKLLAMGVSLTMVAR
jgi:hypothetical protein